MQKFTLITERDFTDKFNEFNNVLRLNFRNIVKVGKWLLWMPVLLGIYLYYVVDREQEANIFDSFYLIDADDGPLIFVFAILLCFCSCVASSVILVVLKPFFDGEKSADEIDIRNADWRLLARVLPQTLVPIVFWCAFAAILLNIREVWVGVLLMFLSLTPQSTVLLFYNISVCVALFEGDKKYVSTGRVFKLIVEELTGSVGFVLAISILGLMLPFVFTIPLYVLGDLKMVMLRDMGTDFMFELMCCLTTILSVMAFMVYCLFIAIAGVIQYGSAVERVDNVSFNRTLKNFDNL